MRREVGTAIFEFPDISTGGSFKREIRGSRGQKGKTPDNTSKRRKNGRHTA